MYAVPADPYGGEASRRRLLFVLSGMAVLFLLFGLRLHPGVGIASLVTFTVILTLFWRPGEPLVLIYVFLFQWLESSIGIFYANIHDLPLDDARQFATLLLLIGLLVQAIGVRLGTGPLRGQYRGLAERQLLGISQRTWFRLYLAALVIAATARVLATLLPGLSQPLLVLPFLKWAAFVIFTFATFYRKDSNRSLWFGVFLFELAFSLGDYFSSFKFVFVFTFLGVALAQIRFSTGRKVALAIIFAMAILFASIWSGIKGEYRHFVSGGQQEQIVTVEYGERLAKLGELVSEMDRNDVANGFDVLVRRVEYTEYFADVTAVVPEFISHTLGELWIDAFTRPLMPRLFFPDKPVIDESELTSTYTGRDVAGFQQGTQISIGYIAEAYIDFGPYGMMPLMFMLGLVQGWVYRWLLRGERLRGVLGIGLACAVFVMSCGSIGMSSAKLVGSFVVSLLVVWLFVRLLLPTLRVWIGLGDDEQAGRRSHGMAG